MRPKSDKKKKEIKRKKVGTVRRKSSYCPLKRLCDATRKQFIKFNFKVNIREMSASDTLNAYNSLVKHINWCGASKAAADDGGWKVVFLLVGLWTILYGAYDTSLAWHVMNAYNLYRLQEYSTLSTSSCFELLLLCVYSYAERVEEMARRWRFVCNRILYILSFCIETFCIWYIRKVEFCAIYIYIYRSQQAYHVSGI